MTKQTKEVKESSEVVVTNNYTSSLSVFGVVIEKGESKEVPDFKADHAVIAKWLKSKVISIK